VTVDSGLWALAPIVVVAYTIAGASGFGAMVVALTLGAQLFPVADLLPVLVPLSVAGSATIVLRNRREVDRALLVRRVLPLMAAGAAAGVAVAPLLVGAAAKRAFGALVVVLAAAEMVRALRSAGEPAAEDASFAEDAPPAEGTARAPDARPGWGAAPWLLASGVTHGLFASGGPLLVYALSRLRLGKHAFRATLTAVWLVLNVGLTAVYAARGGIGAPEARAIGTLLPAVPLGVLIGDRIHDRLDPRKFRALVGALLALAGVGLLQG
jgi:hypothetical protein